MAEKAKRRVSVGEEQESLALPRVDGDHHALASRPNHATVDLLVTQRERCQLGVRAPLEDQEVGMLIQFCVEAPVTGLRGRGVGAALAPVGEETALLQREARHALKARVVLLGLEIILGLGYYPSFTPPHQLVVGIHVHQNPVPVQLGVMKVVRYNNRTVRNRPFREISIGNFVAHH